MIPFLANEKDLYTCIDSDAAQTCLDLSFDLAAMGRYAGIVKTLSSLEESCLDCKRKALYYVLGYYKNLLGMVF